MREFLMLAQTYNPAKHRIAGWYVSEKLDGIRAFWDGGVSRGQLTGDVPWANPRCRIPISTGLWSRYANVIVAPDYWLDKLPGIFLDGELYTGNFQDVSSIVRRHTPDDRWRKVQYLVFDSPGPLIFDDDFINNPNCKMQIKYSDCVKLVPGLEDRPFNPTHLFDYYDSVHPQDLLPDNEASARSIVEGMLDDVLGQGGEGLILRRPNSLWTPKRVNWLLKVKPALDSEGVVTGVFPGAGKYEGMLGSLTINWKGKTFQLSGMNDNERVLGHFQNGDVVQFRYRELTNDGIPKEARYWRKR